MATAILAGGCFWCLEAVFVRVTGVDRVISGYCGGTGEPRYEVVCSGTTGHAEAVRIDFDPGQVSYARLLDIFFAIHDPTTLNRQGADVGTQYRSAIFVTAPEQRAEADAAIRRANEALGGQVVVTEVVDAGDFHRAEDYHQGYFANNPGQGYCAFVVAPKVAKFRRNFAELLKPDC
ncbi:MAG: peptide-methionine (S)-S-oxide reductase MsrA [Betaproteobacteria bacterium]|nr:peptide-methionine (S)-S-oxide reductase MsrA [Betaproteobacteria bacterium]